MTREHFLRFTVVDAVRTTATGLEADLHGERLQVDVVRADVVRLRISRGGRFDERPTYALRDDLRAALFGEPTAFEVHLDRGEARLTTDRLVVTVGLAPFTLDVRRPDGTCVLETAGDAETGFAAYATLNDAFTWERRCAPDDAIYGLGEKAGAFDRRGRDFTLWNTDVLDPQATGEFVADRAAGDPRADRTSTEFDPYYVSIPLLLHHDRSTGHVAGAFVDNGHRAHYDLRPEQSYGVRFEGGQYAEYVIAGPGLPDVVEAYTWLTGRAPLPPRWALGYHQCRWWRYTQADVEAIARRLRADDVPCDALWLDIEHMAGYRVFTWDDELFPDPRALVETLADDGLRLVTIVDPGVKREPGYAVYDEAVARDVLCRTEGGDHYVGQVWPGSTVFPDFVTEEGRAWWGELNARHVASGLAGIWNDMNEPATGALPPDAMRFGRGADPHGRWHNSYALLMAMGTVEGLRAAQPDRRTFVLSRAGSAGIQRYAANWMGDNQSRWDHLRLSIAMACGLGVSGQPFVGADIGGFAGDPTPELFLRWAQAGALAPFCRNHSMLGVPQYPWSFGPVVLDGVRAAIRLRYRLLPYLYAAFVEATETGAPVQRPLVWAHQHDPLAGTVDDQFLLGRDLLVAPVVAPGVTARPVYLPEGRWWDWHAGTAYDGPRFVVAEAPLDRIPLYARGGAVVPMWESAPPSAGDHEPTAIELLVLPPAGDGTHTSWLHEDDGATTRTLDGEHLRTRLELTRQGDRLTLEVTTTGHGYAGHARERLVVRLPDGLRDTPARLDGEPVGPGPIVVPHTDGGFAVDWDLGLTDSAGLTD